MFLQLPHKELDVYKVGKAFVLLCYKSTNGFPPEEKYGLTQQIRRAALSVQLNIAEGSSRKSVTERKRFYEIARGSVIEIDAAFDVAAELSFVKETELTDLGSLLVRCYQMLTKMIYQ
jgi:four helix bundle protein